ncbi:MAG: type II toxin-antitoxin system RatA family toxin [Methylocella sp.]
MPSFHTTRLVPHGAKEMFELVTDVESYPRFVPLCRALRVRRRDENDGRLTLIADMEVGYKAIRETFTSRVTCERSKRTILVEYIDGPFKHLENRWIFHDRDDGRACVVEFYINYEFKNHFLGALMGRLFDSAFRKFAAAFEDRANVVYGKAR